MWTKEIKPLVSIIIPVYNVEAYLSECIESVIKQSYENIEIIIVDDGSKDRGGAIADEYANDDYRIKVVHQKNAGLSAARNTGIEKAEGEWLFFVDSDDFIEVDAVETLLETAIDNDAMVSMATYTTVSEKSGNRNRMHVTSQVIRNHEELAKYMLSEGKQFCYVWLKLFKKEVFETARFAVGKKYEDLYFLPDFIKIVESMAIVDKSIYNYRLRDSSIVFSGKIDTHMDGLYARENCHEFVEKEYPALLGYAKDSIIEYAAYMMGKITLAGRKYHKKEWSYTVNSFRNNIKGSKRESLYLKGLVCIFRISPALLGRLCKIYSSIKNR